LFFGASGLDNGEHYISAYALPSAKALKILVIFSASSLGKSLNDLEILFIFKYSLKIFFGLLFHQQGNEI
jgi:hypothetical protein